jgi:uncharacterized membrane protein
MDPWLVSLVLGTALASGLMAGVYFAFSVAVMPGLRRLPAPAGVAAMQAINRAILNPLFLAVFMGSAVLAGLVAVSSLWTWSEGAGLLRLVGGLVYVLGSNVLTIAYHVPRNEALDGLDATDRAAGQAWSKYLAEWVPWNHVRALASLAAATLLVVASRAS